MDFRSQPQHSPGAMETERNVLRDDEATDATENALSCFQFPLTVALRAKNA